MGSEVTAAAQPAAESQIPPEAVYTYQRADGTVERANTIEEAREICPVLGRASLEQAKVLLELASLGNDALAKEATSKDDRHAKTETTEPAQDALAAKPKPTEYLLEEPTNQQITPEPIQARALESAATPVFERPLPEKLDVAVLAELERQRELSVKDETPQTEQVLERADVSTDEVVESSPAPSTLNLDMEQAPAEVPAADRLVAHVQPAEAPVAIVEDSRGDVQPEATEPSPTVELIGMDLRTGQTEHGSELVDGTPAPISAPETVTTEVMDVYDKLVSIMQGQVEPQGLPAEIEGDVPIKDLAESTQSPVYQDFDAYVATQSVEAQPPTLEVVQNQANEQPLEQTMMQIAAVLFKAELSEPDQELERVVSELREVIDSYHEQGEEYPELTPEITEQLIRFLRVVGYEEPGEVLIECISAHGYLFLWQAVEHVVDQARMTELDDKSIAAVASDSDGNVKTKVAKYLFGLLGVPNAEPVT